MFPGTGAEKAKVPVGGKLISISGIRVQSSESAQKRLKNKKPGDEIVLKIEFEKESNSAPIVLSSASKINQFLEGEQARLETEQIEKQQRQEMLELMDKIENKHGPIVALSGSIQEDAIGQPEISIQVCNASTLEIDAIEIKVSMFDKFGNPVPGIFGNSHEKTALYQNSIGARSFEEMSLSVPFHNTVGVAKISVVKYLPTGGEPTEVPEPFVIEVRK